MSDEAPVIIPAPTEIVPKAFHAIMDASGCDLTKLQNEENIIAWLNSLTAIIGDAVGDATVVSNAHGATGAMVYQQGSADVQCVDADAQIYIDIFSFTEFDPQATEESIRTFFDADRINKILLPRNASVTV